MTSTADPPAGPVKATPRRALSELLDRPAAPAAFAVAGVVVALVSQFAIVAGFEAAMAALGFVPAVLLFGCAALALHRRRTDAAQAAPFELSRRWEIAALVAIIALAAFFRFFRFTEFPPGLWYDEAVNGADAIWIIDHSHLTVWRSSNFGHSTLYFYLLIASFKTFGFTVFAFRLVPALAGMAAVVAFYALARWLVGAVPALVATALLAVSRYAVTFSRISWEASLQPLLEIMAVFFFVRALETKSRFYFFMAGGSLAAGIYTYLGFRFVPVVMLFLLIYVAAAQWRLLRDNVPGLVIYAVSFAIVVAPLGQFAVRHQDLFLERTREINVFNQIDREGTWAPLRHNIAATVKMMNVAGDKNGRHNLPGAPMLDGVSAALLVLGAAASVWSIRNWRRGSVFGWLVLAVVPGALTISNENPSAIRDIGAIPPLFLLTGLAVAVLYQSMSVTRAGTILFGVAALAMVGASAAVNYHEFFDEQAHSQAVFDAFMPQTTFIGETMADHAGKDDVFVEDAAATTPAVVVLTRGKPWRTYDPARDFVLPRTGRNALLILNERQFGVVPALRQLYPNLVRDDDVDPYGRVMFTRVTIPASDIDAVHELSLTVHDGPTATGAVLSSRRDGVAREWSAADLGSAGVATAVWDGYLWSGRAIADGTLAVEAPGDVTIEIDGKTVAAGGPRAEAARLQLDVGQHRIRIVAVLRAPGATSLSYVDERGPNAVAAEDLLYGTGVERGFRVTWHKGDDFAGDVVASGQLPFAIGANAENDGRAIEYRGLLDVTSEGEYEFELRGENSTQLFIDDDLAVDNGGSHGHRVVTGTVHLSKGSHVVTIEYVVGFWPDWALFRKPPGGSWTRIDGSEFAPAPASYAAPPAIALTPDPEWDDGRTFEGLASPAAVTTLADGTVVAGSGHTLAFIDAAGQLQRTLQLDDGADVTDLATGPNGEIVVADRASKSIRVLDAGGNELRRIDGPFPSLAGIDLRGDIVFVASPALGKLYAVPFAGGEPAQLDFSALGVAERAAQPSDVAVGDDGTAYAADFERARIVISADGKTARSVAGVPGVGTLVPHEAIWRHVLLVTDPTGGRIVLYDARGRQRGAFTFPKSAGEVTPVGIAATADGRVYVAADSGPVYAFRIVAPPDLSQ